MVLLAEASRLGLLQFCRTSEAEIERWGIPKQDSVSGLLYGAKVEYVSKPIAYGRVVTSYSRTARSLQEEFLNSITEPEFRNLCVATGAYQGKNKPLNRNQALDAFHLWCALYHNMDYFLTMDYKLIKVVSRSSRLNGRLRLVSPCELTHNIIWRSGVLKGLLVMFQAVRNARRIGRMMDIPPNAFGHRDHLCERRSKQA